VAADAALERRLERRAAQRLAIPFAAWLGPLAVGLAASLPFLSAVRAYFIGDDFGLIWLLSNKPSLHVLTLFHRAWTESIYGIVPDELRPTLALSYQVDSLWGPGNPVGYHLGNIAQHVVCGLLIYAIGLRVAGLSRLGATFAAVLFAVLPIQPDTVAWISGRADSLPALFYLAAFLGFALWRRSTHSTAGEGRYLALSSLALFLALFTKQSAITLIATLLAYDLLVERRPIQARLGWLAPYLPFLALTVGYILLRKLLFDNVVREQELLPGWQLDFLSRQGNYINTLLVGSSLTDRFVPPELILPGQYATWVGLAGALLLTLWQTIQVHRGRTSAWLGRLLFFGPVWWLIQVVPLVVTYDSPRHLYLAAAGPCLVAALLGEALWRAEQRPRRLAGGVLAAALLLGSLALMQKPLANWNHSASVSERMRDDLWREAQAAPANSLVVVGAPMVGRSRFYHTWLWMWSAPFAYQPPFMPGDLTQQRLLIEPPDVFCCPRDQWEARTRATLGRWLAQAPPGPAIVLRWNPDDGEMFRETDADGASLSQELRLIHQAPTWLEMCQRLDGILLGTIGISCAE
jgi:hypothetical protein